MNPFLEIPIAIVNSEKEEKTTTARIMPGQIEYYYPGFYSGTIIVMKSGNSMMALSTFAEIDAALAGYDKFVKTNAGKFGNLQLTPKEKPKIIHVTN